MLLTGLMAVYTDDRLLYTIIYNGRMAGHTADHVQAAEGLMVAHHMVALHTDRAEEHHTEVADMHHMVAADMRHMVVGTSIIKKIKREMPLRYFPF